MTTKVFVGNLAFQTTDQALAEAFLDVGKVKSGVVITRGRRSLGYGFVEFESPESALEAVNSKNNTLLKGRTIKVELASDNPIRPERPERNPNASDNQSSGDNTGQRRRRRRNNNTGDRPRNQSGNNSGENQSNQNTPSAKSGNTGGTPNSATGGDSQAQGGRRRRRRSRRPTNNNPSNNTNISSNTKPLPKDNVDDRVLSTTAVFVANLPFSVNDEELKAFFKENNPKSAHVVVTRNNRSRGYGFVDFSTDKDQKNAILGKNNAKFGERVITVTASYKTQETNEN